LSIIEAFVDHKVTGEEFFNYENEAEILKKLGDKVKALGVRKNLMRIVRKVK